MNVKSIMFRNILLILVFGAVGLTTFTENVRTVQILGLLAVEELLELRLHRSSPFLDQSRQKYRFIVNNLLLSPAFPHPSFFR